MNIHAARVGRRIIIPNATIERLTSDKRGKIVRLPPCRAGGGSSARPHKNESRPLEPGGPSTPKKGTFQQRLI